MTSSESIPPEHSPAITPSARAQWRADLSDQVGVCSLGIILLAGQISDLLTHCAALRSAGQS